MCLVFPLICVVVLDFVCCLAFLFDLGIFVFNRWCALLIGIFFLYTEIEACLPGRFGGDPSFQAIDFAEDDSFIASKNEAQDFYCASPD